MYGNMRIISIIKTGVVIWWGRSLTIWPIGILRAKISHNFLSRYYAEERGICGCRAFFFGDWRVLRYAWS